jgi:hypothetical protein
VARTEDEIKEAMEKGLAVILAIQPSGKLALTWGKIKM